MDSGQVKLKNTAWKLTSSKYYPSSSLSLGQVLPLASWKMRGRYFSVGVTADQCFENLTVLTWRRESGLDGQRWSRSEMNSPQPWAQMETSTLLVATEEVGMYHKIRKLMTNNKMRHLRLNFNHPIAFQQQRDSTSPRRPGRCYQRWPKPGERWLLWPCRTAFTRSEVMMESNTYPLLKSKLTVKSWIHPLDLTFKGSNGSKWKVWIQADAH